MNVNGNLTQGLPLIEAFRRFSTPDWIVAGTALFIICNGVSVCIGWWMRVPILVQLSPDAPTHFNTALIFISLGVGELGLVLRRREVVITMAVVVICAASSEFAEYAFGLNLHVDTLFAVPFVGLDAPYPGRMSGNTIACFFLVCAAQILISKPDPQVGAATTAAVILKSLAGGIAFLAVLGYLVGLKSAYGWTDAVGMSIRSCAGFLLIVIARIAALWQRDIVEKASLPNWFLPFLTSSVLSISVGLIWIFASPLARPYMVDPLYQEVAHRRSSAMVLSVGTLIVLGAVSMLVARRKAMFARESEERFRTLANSIPQLAWIGRADGFLIWYNQRWHAYTGTTPEQMDGWGWQSVHDPALLPNVLTRWREAIALAQPFEMEFPLRGADGTFRNFLTRGQPMKNSDGCLVQWFGTCTDVDLLKRTEQSLRMTKARLESTLKASSVGTWTWDIAGDRLIGDECTARMFSVETCAAAAGLPAAAYLQVVHEDDRTSVAEALERAIQLGGVYDIEYRVRQGDGDYRWLQAKGRVEFDGAGNAAYFHGAVIDTTDRKQSELVLRDNNLQLERSNRDLEDFAYIASHDLKTPLSGIKSTALWLEEDLHDLSEGSRKLLGLMRSRINRMEKLLDDLLTFSRVGRIDTTASEASLADIIASVIEGLNPPAHINIRVEGELPAIVTASAQLEQVLRNLINNAIKHHDKPSGEVVLSGNRVGEFVEFVVSDDGPGILPQFHEKIFQLFQTLKRRDEVESTGMGLTIVKKLVERQNCRVSVHSQGNGTGTQFRFQWPMPSSRSWVKEPADA